MYCEPSDVVPDHCRFVFNDGPAKKVLAECVAADHRAAQLSPAYRFYYRVRAFVPVWARQALQRARPIRVSKEWYLPHAFVSSLATAIRASGEITTIHPWPNGAEFAFVLTHDVETADGMRRVAVIADLEEQLGVRSCWNIVPHKYPVDLGLLRDLQQRGFEIGVHGYNHDGRLFMTREIFDQRVPAINAALTKFGAVGFRAPMVHRNLNWLQDLDVEYDASCFDIDPFQAMPGGVGGVWPFIAGRFVELPYTLPQDHTLFVALGERSGRIWERKLAYVAQLGGMALVITHPDYLDVAWRLDAYTRLLEKVRDMQGVWCAVPRDVAAWWRVRDASRLVGDSSGGWQVEGPASSSGRVAALGPTPSAVGGLCELSWRSLQRGAAAVADRVGHHG